MQVFTGFHSIEEKVNAALKNTQNSKPGKESGSADYKIYFSKPGPRVKKILESAKKSGIAAEQVDENKLNSLVAELPETLQDHRGIVLTFSGVQKKAENLVDLDDWIKTHTSADSNDKLTVVILDRVTDPHNVGAIIRSCDQFGANLVIIPEHNSASDIAENEVIGRTSAGASAWVPVSIVNNLVRAVEKLKAAGFWVYGADAGGQTCGKIDFADKTAVIMGSEGTGISALLEDNCDSIVSIPTCGKIDSLNVSVAAGVLLYEIYRRKMI